METNIFEDVEDVHFVTLERKRASSLLWVFMKALMYEFEYYFQS